VTLPLASQLAVEEVRDRAGLFALASEWERLCAETNRPGPFYRPTWFAIWAASLANDLRVLVAHRGGRVVGVLPLMMERRRLAGLPARVLRSLSDDHSQRFDLIVAPAEPKVVAAALWRHLRDMGGWDALELREIPDQGSAAEDLIVAAEASGHATRRWAAMQSPYLLIPDDKDQIGSAKFRSNLRRRKKKLEAEIGPVSLEKVTTDLDAALKEGFALEAAGWKGERGTAIACDPALFSRYSQLAKAFAARGELALYFLKAGQRRVAFHFALIEDGVYFLFKPGFDPALSNYGLGHLLIDAVIRESGIHELDFLGDDMPWKRDWTDQLRPHSWRYVFSRSPYGRALGTWKFDLVPTLKRLLKR
jgi:CelD/BcsL family acetyltransferase involved in cellulose biosynthesis